MYETYDRDSLLDKLIQFFSVRYLDQQQSSPQQTLPHLIIGIGIKVQHL